MTTPQLKRPGGRSAQVQELVRQALEDLVAEQGRDRVTIPDVAERAGVSASSIYRRWGDLAGLLSETATHRLDPNRPLPNTGDVRKDLTTWARELITSMAQASNTSLLKAAAALANENGSDCLQRRRTEAELLIQQAQSRGEITPHVQQVIDHVVAPIVFRLIFGGPALKPTMATVLVNELLSLAPRTSNQRA